MTMNINFVTPKGQGGVVDFGNKLVENLLIDQIATATAWNKDSNNLIGESTLSAECLFLQYSGYGFSNRGAPLWLLDKLKTDRPNIKSFGIFFHELYAFGPPWGSAFWLSPVQRHIARQLAVMSDFWITNREVSAQWLRRFAGCKPNAVLPVFSNVGEAQAYTSDRARKIVVFGSASVRSTAYLTMGESLFLWARVQGLEVHDIGPAIDTPAICLSIKRAGVVVHGRLEATELSKQLADAEFGIVAYPVAFVAKSGVFAAYCAHGVCPLLISECYESSDGLFANQHYVAGLPTGAIQLGNARRIGYKAWSWYQPHRIWAHSNTLKRLLSEVSIGKNHIS